MMIPGIGLLITATDGASRALTRTDMALTRLGKSAQATGGLMFGAFGAMVGGAVALQMGIGGLAVLTKSASYAADFEYAMERVGIVTRATGKDFQGLKDEAKRLGLETEFTATEVAESMQVLAQAGFSTKDITGDLTSVVLDLTSASGEMINTAQAAAVVTTAYKTFGKQIRDDFGGPRGAADMMVRATQITRLQFGDLERALASVSGEARIFGQDFGEVLTMMGAARDVGFSASGGANAIRIAMRNLVGNAARFEEVTGGKQIHSKGKLRSFLDVMGDLEQKWKEDKTSEFDQSQDIIRVFSKRGLRGAGIVTKAEFFNQITGQYLQGTAAIKAMTAEINNSKGATLIAAERMRNTFRGTIRRIGGSLQNLAIIIGDQLLPVLTKFAKQIFAILMFVNKFAASHPRMVKMGVAILAVASALLVFAGMALIAAGAVAMLAAMVWVLFGAISAISAPLTVIIAGLFVVFLEFYALVSVLLLPIIGALLLFISAIQSNSATLKVIAGSILAVAAAFTVVLGIVFPLLGMVGTAITAVVAVGLVFLSFWRRFTTMMAGAAQHMRPFKEAVAPLVLLFRAFGELLSNDFELSFLTVRKLKASNLFGFFTKVAKALQWIEHLLENIGKSSKGVWDALMNSFTGWFGVFAMTFGEFGSGMAEAINLTFQHLGGDLDASEFKLAIKKLLWETRNNVRLAFNQMVKDAAGMSEAEKHQLAVEFAHLLEGTLGATWEIIKGSAVIAVLVFEIGLWMGGVIALGIVQGIWDSRGVLLDGFLAVLNWVLGAISVLLLSLARPVGGNFGAAVGWALRSGLAGLLEGGAASKDDEEIGTKPSSGWFSTRFGQLTNDQKMEMELTVDLQLDGEHIQKIITRLREDTPGPSEPVPVGTGPGVVD